MKVTQSEFDSLVDTFLLSLDDEYENEIHGTPRRMYGDMLSDLRAFLFSAEIAKAARFEKYKELKSEFEREDT